MHLGFSHACTPLENNELIQKNARNRSIDLSVLAKMLFQVVVEVLGLNRLLIEYHEKHVTLCVKSTQAMFVAC